MLNFAIIAGAIIFFGIIISKIVTPSKNHEGWEGTNTGGGGGGTDQEEEEGDLPGSEAENQK